MQFGCLCQQQLICVTQLSVCSSLWCGWTPAPLVVSGPAVLSCSTESAVGFQTNIHTQTLRHEMLLHLGDSVEIVESYTMSAIANIRKAKVKRG